MSTKLSVSNATKYTKNPFIDEDRFIMNRGKQQIIAGSANRILVNPDTGETEGIAILHKFKEVDKEQFVKIYIDEIKALFDLSRSGLKVFGYFLQAMRINTDEIYVNIPKLMAYCNYRYKAQAYKGLGELLSNKIIAMSADVNIWFINPHIIFNGDRIAFIKQYKLKDKDVLPTQTEMFKQLEQAREKIEEQPKD